MSVSLHNTMTRLHGCYSSRRSGHLDDVILVRFGFLKLKFLDVILCWKGPIALTKQG